MRISASMNGICSVSVCVCVCVHLCTLLPLVSGSTFQKSILLSFGIGCRGCAGFLIFIGHFPSKSPMISGSFAEDLQLKASNASSPPCIEVSSTLIWYRCQKFSKVSSTLIWFRLAKMHKIPYLYRSFSVKEPCN